MRSQSLFTILAVFVAAAVRINAADTEQPKDIFKNAGLKKGQYIVELGATPSGKRHADAHDEFLDHLDRRAGGRFRTRTKFASKVFNGIAIEFSDPDEFVDLASIPNVLAVHPVTVFTAPEPLDVKKDVKLEDPGVIPPGQSAHYMTGVNKAHELGYSGKGIKIGIIDTGIDYTHPALGGGFGPGFKVEKGYDLVGDDFFGTDPQPDSDPMDTCQGHGTHVAGIIAAAGANAFNVTGVAPDTTLYAYRVFSCFGYTDMVILLEATERAFNDGADIITLSLGSNGPWSTDIFSVLTSNLAEQGRVLTIAAGNNGNGGPLLISSPASGKEVIAVGSVQNTRVLRQILTTNAKEEGIPYITRDSAIPSGTAPIPETRTDIPVYIFGDGMDNTDLCNGFGDSPPDLSKYAVLIREPKNCSFWSLWNELYVTNLTLLMVWDTTGGFGSNPGRNFIQILDADGLWMVKQAQKGNLTVTFPQEDSSVEFPNTDAGLMSYFSGWGPSADMLFKPAISAPGGQILSTLPVNMGSWAVMSGTSMSTPYVAGIAALLLEAKGKGVARELRSLLQTTATGLPSSNEINALPQSLAHQGAGITNVAAALQAVSSVRPAELLLNDTINWKRDHTITIKNDGTKPETYTLWHEPAGTVISLPDKINYQLYPVPVINAPVAVSFSKTSVTVSPGTSVNVTVNITPPSGLDSKQLPLVSGWIHVNAESQGGDRLRVSYMGFTGALKDAQVISTGNDFLVPDDGGLPAVWTRNANGKMVAVREQMNWTTDGESPVFAISYGQPSRYITWDIIDANLNISMTIPNPLDSSPALGKRGRPSWWPKSSNERRPGSSTSYNSVPVVGNWVEFIDFGRHAPGVQSTPPLFDAWLPTEFLNGTIVPPGTYKILVRALRITGNPDNLEDYDIWVSPPYGWNLEST